jgi:hypothetical protein
VSDGAGARGRRRAKDQELAAMLKARQVERTTGQCPWDCGRAIPNGGMALLIHLGQCHGTQRTDRRRR